MTDVLYVLDEAAQLGALNTVDTALNIGRGYGVKLALFYQSLGQLRRCFTDGQDQTVLSNVTQIFFAVNDNITADYVSARLGDATIVVNSGGTSSGTSSQSSSSPQSGPTYSSSWNSSQNWAPQARRLLKAEEVIALPPRTAITLTPGVPPIRTQLLRYYEEKWLSHVGNDWRSHVADLAILVRAAACCATLSMLAALLTAIAIHVRHDSQNMRDDAPMRTHRSFSQGIHDVGVSQKTVRRTERNDAAHAKDYAGLGQHRP